MGYRIGVDTGGTFTDTVAVDERGRVGVGKALSTHGNLAEGILASIAEAAADLGVAPGELLAGADVLAHATTVGINALLTGTGARVGLVTTAGFEATLPIARGNKVIGLPEAARTEATRWEKPPLLVPRRRIVGIRERIDAHGEVLVPLDPDDVRAALARLGERGVESVAVSLIWSVVEPCHELAVEELAAEVLPGVPVTLSHRLARRIGEYERTATTVLNAYVGPLVAGYVDDLRHRFAEAGFAGRFVVTQTSGGVRDAASIAESPVDTLNSGPVGCITAAADLGRRLDHPDVVATDVGGTSFDVGLVEDGAPPFAPRPMIGRHPLATPVVELTSIGTGGGSIAWLDETLGALRVGPASAGASPGPACYGRGGERPTVTDAAVALGYLGQLGGRLELDAEAARRAIEAHVASPLGIAVERAAEDILRVANAQMADLVRRVTVQRGHDPSGFALYAYGGAAPQYVGRYAAELGVAEVIIPGLASVFSAYGAAATDLRSLAEQEIRPELLAEAIGRLPTLLDDLEARARADIGAHGPDSTVQRRVSLRFARQVHALAVAVEGDPDPGRLDAAFRAAYERLVGAGTAFASAPIEITGLAVEARAPVAAPVDLRPAAPSGDRALAPVGTREAHFDGRWFPCPVHDGTRLAAGSRIEGPAFIELPTTTVVVYPGQTAVQEPSGDLRLELGAGPSTSGATRATPRGGAR